MDVMSELQEFIHHAYEKSEGFRKRMMKSGLKPHDIQTKEDLSKLPVLKKEDLTDWQKENAPFGGLTTIPSSKMARLFMSPGPIYDPQSIEDDHWRFSEALAAAGFNDEDIVQNTFSYHLSPAGFMFDSALRKLGATVIPAGTGNRELQVQILRDLKVTGFVGTPSFLAILLDKVEEKGWKSGKEIILNKAFFTAEMVTDEIREKCKLYDINVYEGYGTADCGLVAYDDKQASGLKLSRSVIVQLCDPLSGEELKDGEGEIVVTLFDRHYPLIRFGTGDLSRWVRGYEGERLVGILGRVSDGVKVKGMFVRKKQLADVLQQLGYSKYKAVVTRVNNQDQLDIYIESEQAVDDQLTSKIKDVIRVTPIITTILPGTLNQKDIRLIDERKF